jgi:hypothetical protein
MANQSGIAITIKAFLPTGKTLDEQFTALGLVRDAHATGDYTTLLKAAKVDEVKTEQKVRRVEDTPAATAEPQLQQADTSGLKEAFDSMSPEGDIDQVEAQESGEGDGDEVPAFLKKTAISAA